jgi:hypothetical protein
MVGQAENSHSEKEKMGSTKESLVQRCSEIQLSTCERYLD